jgi:hypothetical protein
MEDEIDAEVFGESIFCFCEQDMMVEWLNFHLSLEQRLKINTRSHKKKKGGHT